MVRFDVDDIDETVEEILEELGETRTKKASGGLAYMLEELNSKILNRRWTGDVVLVSTAVATLRKKFYHNLNPKKKQEKKRRKI